MVLGVDGEIQKDLPHDPAISNKWHTIWEDVGDRKDDVTDSYVLHDGDDKRVETNSFVFDGTHKDNGISDDWR